MDNNNAPPGAPEKHDFADANNKTTDKAKNADSTPAIATTGWAINTLAILAIFASLYLASSLLLPLILSMLLALLLSPVVTRMAKLGLPRPAGAMLIITALGGSIVTGSYFLIAPASAWIEQIPGAINSLQTELSPITQQIKDVSEAAEKVDNLGEDEQQARQRLVQVEGEDLRDAFLERAQAFVLGSVVLFFLLYFLLAGSDRLRRNVLEALPDKASEDRALVIMRRMQNEISRYLLSISIINVLLGSVVAALCWQFDLPNPLLWGAMAATLNFVPYIGPVVGLLVITAVSIVTLPEPQSLAVPALFFLITSLEGQLITPTVLGRNLSLNPIFIFLALIFWGWMWGVIGALLAVPIMVTLKITCDNVPRLKPVGMVLGR